MRLEKRARRTGPDLQHDHPWARAHPIPAATTPLGLREWQSWGDYRRTPGGLFLCLLLCRLVAGTVQSWIDCGHEGLTC